MTERERYLFWKLVNYFIIDLDYRLVHIDREENEIWLETVRHKKVDVVRILAEDTDWANWLKRDIIQTGLKAEGIRKQLMKRDFNVLNIYVSGHAPVDDYEFVIQQPHDVENGKTHIRTLLMAEETLDESLVQINETFDSPFQIQASEFYDLSLTDELRQSAIQKAKNREREERELFEHGKPFFTYLFIAVQVLMFLIVEINGGSTNVETLIQYGAKFNPLILAGEWWRFFTPIFLHIGLLHLLMNTLALYYLGTAVERIFGRFRFLWIYLFSGFAGSVASFVFTSNLSAGASGAIFGCFGALLYMGVINTKLFFRTIGMNVIVVIIINLIFGFTVPGIDNAGHIGGLIGGFLATGIVHFPGKRKWGLQSIFLLAAAAAVYFMLHLGYHNDRPDAVNARAQDQIESGEYEAAYDTLSKFISEGKGDAVSYFQLAYAEIQLQKYDDARKHLEKAVELEPGFHEAHFNLALIYFEQGDTKKAKEHASKAEKISDQEKYRDFLKKIE
ncbi:rhomboid family protein [Siminovitchia fortis]|uniref:Rhomboid family intramembrane serine protease n=1 Tax=Siminovitchia fortis TaxID=254758 RepID=A0A443J3U5_9BACI|nr:rhomboid family intramembrane serine protease [Siminovitchia fortis]RWR15119.1 rhomboid family intramembrane serine protease [Siminovitchia fortis]WHY82742.1 rhomboid family intramembrane serine protease [Siminovitchia fortis]